MEKYIYCKHTGLMLGKTVGDVEYGTQIGSKHLHVAAHYTHVSEQILMEKFEQPTVCFLLYILNVITAATHCRCAVEEITQDASNRVEIAELVVAANPRHEELIECLEYLRDFSALNKTESRYLTHIYRGEVLYALREGGMQGMIRLLDERLNSLVEDYSAHQMLNIGADSHQQMKGIMMYNRNTFLARTYKPLSEVNAPAERHRRKKQARKHMSPAGRLLMDKITLAASNERVYKHSNIFVQRAVDRENEAKLNEAKKQACKVTTFKPGMFS